MLILVTGALAGLFHVLSGPDHLAAVAPLAVDGRRKGWIAGWTWGLGHASGVVVVALLGVLLRELLPPIDILSAWSERVVGAALIGIGLWALSRCLRVGPSAAPARRTHARPPARAGWPRMDSPAGTRARLVLHGRAARRRRELALLRRAACARVADDDSSGPLYRCLRRRHGRRDDDVRSGCRNDCDSRHTRPTRVSCDDDRRCAAGDCGGWRVAGGVNREGVRPLAQICSYGAAMTTGAAIAPSNITRAFCACASRSPANAGSNPCRAARVAASSN